MCAYGENEDGDKVIEITNLNNNKKHSEITLTE